MTCNRLSRRCLLGLLLSLPLAGVLAVALFLAAPAGALVITVGKGVQARQVGVQPTSETFLDGGGVGNAGEPVATNFNNPEGNQVMRSVNTYVVYWDPLDLYHGEWQGLIDRYMSDLSGATEAGPTGVFAVNAQYTDRTGRAATKSQFLGPNVDTAPYPPAGCEDEDLGKAPAEITCLTDAQLQEQLYAFIGNHKLQTGPSTIYFLLTPPGVGVCVDSGPSASHCSQNNGFVSNGGFCSYHSYFFPTPATTVLYAVIPWTFGGLGGPFENPSPGSMCQDGGWNVNAEAGGPLENSKVPQEPNQLTTRGADGLFDEGLADLAISQLGAEEQNTITDPLLNAWQDKEKVGSEEVAYENTDECRDFFLEVAGGGSTAKKGTQAGDLYNQIYEEGNFYLNDAFNLAAFKVPYPGVPCLPGIRLEPEFTEPPTVNYNELVGFNGMESDITLDAGEIFNAEGKEQTTYPTYTWDFGDGTPTVSGFAPGSPPDNPPTGLCEAPWLAPCAGSVFHAYQYGGIYKVTLTVTDIAGDTAATTRLIKVNGPPPPAPPLVSENPAGGGGPGGSSASPGTAGAPGSGAGSPPPLPGPVATAAAVSSSVKQVARSGLVVHYSVNEQVAGHFEVLLGATVAHHLGITGRAASGLPVGFPRSLVIGQALLVTTKGGHSSVRIKFSKRTATHLRHAHRVSLTLRLIVHNAAAQNPAFTTVISTVVLHH